MGEAQLYCDQRSSAESAELDRLADQAARRFPLPPRVTPKLINISENATYRLDDPGTGHRWALRIHREGYHTRLAIASELAWLDALKDQQAANVPTPIPGIDGDLIQTIAIDGGRPRNVVLFAWETGSEPGANDITGFERLGETAAGMHRHVRSWKRPSWFERHTWNFETTLGATPHWGRWRDGMGMTRDIEEAIGAAVAVIQQRLDRFGTNPAVFNLVHGDMRIANLLMDGSTVKVIDFDDCGFSWFLYDCATTVSFFEEAPEVPELIRAWARGYRRVGDLSPEEEAEIETFVMLRRILLVAWIGSHSETDLARSMGISYTQGTVPLCERYLSRMYKS